MAPLPNLRHEIFVRAYVRRQVDDLKNIRRRCKGERRGYIYGAYKEAYPHVESIQCLYTASSRLFHKPHIQQRIQEVTKRMVKRADITEERVLSQYDEAYELAKGQGKTADMVAATTAQAKLVGLLRDRIEAGAPGDFDKMEDVSDILAEVEKRAGPEAALALADSLGLRIEEKEPEVPEPDTSDFEELEPPSGAVN